MGGIGHNSDKGISQQRLKSFIERIERLEDEKKKALSGDIKEVYSEAKSGGFDTKIMRKVIARRKFDKAELQEQEALIDIYMEVLGDYVLTPLGKSAIDRVSA